MNFIFKLIIIYLFLPKFAISQALTNEESSYKTYQNLNVFNKPIDKYFIYNFNTDLNTNIKFELILLINIFAYIFYNHIK